MTDEMRDRLWDAWHEYETVMGMMCKCIEFGKFCEKVDASNFDEALEAVKNNTWMDWSD